MFPSVLNRKRRQGTLSLESNSLYFFHLQALVSHWLFRHSLLCYRLLARGNRTVYFSFFAFIALLWSRSGWSSERISSHLSKGPPFLTLLVTPVSYFRTCNPREHFDLRSRFLCFLIAKAKRREKGYGLGTRMLKGGMDEKGLGWDEGITEFHFFLFCITNQHDEYGYQAKCGRKLENCERAIIVSA